MYSVYHLYKAQGFGKSAPLHSRNNLKMYSSQSENAISKQVLEYPDRFQYEHAQIFGVTQSAIAKIQ